jgi:alkanesulfonate monooxygenase SsuD/methylene tetrahydromethanopterin reductase-like flavin-dependent oxidoreductase (luciferase family)
MQIGIDSFVENTPDPLTSAAISPSDRMKNQLDEIVRADELGLDVFGIGEHHRHEYVSSAPAIILAAAAARTSRIRLISAVTVLSSEDPVRAFQQFATIDLISRGRAEMIVGRGSFVESYPLFGFDLSHYDDLFAEKLELLLNIRANTQVHWARCLSSPRTEPSAGMDRGWRNAQVFCTCWHARIATRRRHYRRGATPLSATH